MIRLFWTQKDLHPFNVWASEGKGFYLNERSSEGVMLHSAACVHYGSGDNFEKLSRSKWAADAEEELNKWAKENNWNLVRCKDCLK